MRRIFLLSALLLLSLAPLRAEEATTSTSTETTAAAASQSMTETRTLQEQQLQMIMRMNKAEDLRNTEIHKRHEGYIKNIPALSAPVIAPASSEVAPAETTKVAKEKKCGFWCRLFGGGDEPAIPAPQMNDSGTVDVDDF